MQKEATWPDYLLTYGVIAVSGVEYFYSSPEFQLLFFLAAAGIAFARQTPLTARSLSIIIIVFIVELLHALKYNNFVPNSLLSILIRLLLVYLVIHVCGLRFIRYYIDIILVSALISLPIYFLTFFPGVEQFLIQNIANTFFKPPFSVASSMYEGNPSMIVYTFNQLAEEKFISTIIKRNSGPFWEPGAFAVFMTLALLFNLQHEKKFSTRRNWLLIFTMLTTFSTAGYITLFMIIVGYVISSDTVRKSTKIASLLILLPTVVLVYSQTEFMSGKINKNISASKSDNSSRFGSAYFDFVDLARSPLIGFGRLSENRFGPLARLQDFSTHRNNGVTFLLVTYGIPCGLAYFLGLFLFFRRYSRQFDSPPLFALFSFLTVLLAGFSQGVFDRAILISLLFLSDRLRQLEVMQASPLAVKIDPQAVVSPSENY
ncbi:hypothetical protein [Tellurirhabdus bombi]|uniref:hypothetical protein n=1 Tax=Tellurirhabdus bombi TaxID=2907205 RepID=UPI001F1D9043|nr:hypothetical protein [Tellurirhabdus bombi]